MIILSRARGVDATMDECLSGGVAGAPPVTIGGFSTLKAPPPAVAPLPELPLTAAPPCALGGTYRPMMPRCPDTPEQAVCGSAMVLQTHRGPVRITSLLEVEFCMTRNARIERNP